MSFMLAMHSGKVGFLHFDAKSKDMKTEELDIIHEYNEMKIFNKHKYIIFKAVSSDIVMSGIGPPSSNFEDMKNRLPPNECRFVVYSNAASDEKNLMFILWCPDRATADDKTITTSSKEYVKRRLGLEETSHEIIAHDLDFDEFYIWIL